MSLTGRQKVLELSQHDDGKSSITQVPREIRVWCERFGKGYMKTTPEWPANRSGDYVTVIKEWVFTN